MKTKILRALLLVFSMCISTEFAQSKGTESGGGGGVVFRNSSYILLDFLNIDPEFQDSTAFQNLKASQIKKVTGSVIGINSANEDQIRTENQAFDLALKTIALWENFEFETMAGRIHSSFMFPLQWSFTNNELHVPNLFLPEAIKENEKSQVKAAAYYLKDALDNYTVQISIPIWDQMGIWSQAGLLIHESLRQIQIGWSTQYDEKTLQRATAVLVMCKPEAKLNYYLMYLLRNRSDLAQQIYGEFDSMISNHCQRAF